MRSGLGELYNPHHSNSTWALNLLAQCLEMGPRREMHQTLWRMKAWCLLYWSVACCFPKTQTIENVFYRCYCYRLLQVILRKIRVLLCLFSSEVAFLHTDCAFPQPLNIFCDLSWSVFKGPHENKSRRVATSVVIFIADGAHMTAGLHKTGGVTLA